MANQTDPLKKGKKQPHKDQMLINPIKDEMALDQNQEPTLAELKMLEEEIDATEILVQPEGVNRITLDETDDNTDKFNQASAILTGGDIDANFEEADAVGDEAVGGTVAIPDHNIVEEIGAAVGLEMPDRASLRTTEFLEKRDDQRWELDPTSSEDYEQRETESL
ncbi:hypothetical protein PL8927_630119 [Planktothrix serta PCC 8927]|uniref:Uncharacterized protein n=1 Tax=Planktothrix serta PCC 8927 TaxID=671068 RepID=A0A7Z9BSM1_9CYAN|nr:DUF6335 family protein [Planktothrix serta]VXD19664.1 hypothetical protein PL8927_630119 [Planktothrix serta PCC 8927]